jgi:hypothetical protein
VLVGIVMGAAAAAAFGSGTFLQHLSVDRVERRPGDNGPGLVQVLTQAAGRGRWWAGQALSTLGGGLQTGALALAPVGAVTPVVTAGLPVALLLSSFHHGRRPKTGQVVGVLACLAGLAVFVTASHPVQSAHPHLSAGPGALLLGLAVGAALLARYAPHSQPGGALAGACAGTATGVALVAAAATFAEVDVHGAGAAALTWGPYVAALGFLLGTAATQQAFVRGELRWSLPATSVASTVSATGLSVLLLGTRLAAAEAPLWIGAAVVAVAGIALTSATQD